MNKSRSPKPTKEVFLVSCSEGPTNEEATPRLYSANSMAELLGQLAERAATDAELTGCGHLHVELLGSLQS